MINKATLEEVLHPRKEVQTRKAQVVAPMDSNSTIKTNIPLKLVDEAIDLLMINTTRNMVKADSEEEAISVGMLKRHLLALHSSIINSRTLKHTDSELEINGIQDMVKMEVISGRKMVSNRIEVSNGSNALSINPIVVASNKVNMDNTINTVRNMQTTITIRMRNNMAIKVDSNAVKLNTVSHSNNSNNSNNSSMFNMDRNMTMCSKLSKVVEDVADNNSLPAVAMVTALLPNTKRNTTTMMMDSIIKETTTINNIQPGTRTLILHLPLLNVVVANLKIDISNPTHAVEVINISSNSTRRSSSSIKVILENLEIVETAATKLPKTPMANQTSPMDTLTPMDIRPISNMTHRRAMDGHGTREVMVRVCVWSDLLQMVLAGRA